VTRRWTRRFSGAESLAIVCLAAAHVPAQAAGVPTSGKLEEIVVEAQRIGLVGVARSATEGVVPGVQLEGRPVLRAGEVLEVVPGLIVTQHSGDGKANQYFLRGFNLDHGTDFATRVDGIPVNMPTHAHGQGYTDINFLIPELIEDVRYRKGTYYAEQGNFSAAGSVDLNYRRTLPTPVASLTIGEDSYYRGFLAGSTALGAGSLLVGVDYSSTDGPWELEQDFRKLNGLVKYTRGDDENGFGVTGGAYDGEWRSTDQIPLRAVRAGAISRFGHIDATDGGDSHRYSLSLDAWSRGDGGGWSANAYAIDYGLDLFSNFTYALDGQNGDQFEQFDSRMVYGGNITGDLTASLTELPGTLRAGLELRRDDIDPVGLHLTTARVRHDTVREDTVRQTSYSAWVAHDQAWTSWLRTELGVRADYFEFDVESDLAANSGRDDDSIVSPKLSVTLGPWRDTEFFINYGRGFHSNDARGTTIRVDPVDGTTPAEPVDPLVAATGAEVGLRTAALPGLQLAMSAWTLTLDSELLFVGDGGTTEASRKSRRSGVELGAFWTPLDWLIVDADLAWSHARFTGDDPAGNHIPGAVEQVASLGLTVQGPGRWFGGARVRYLGEAPLIEDGSVTSDPTTLVNAEIGYRLTDKLDVSLSVFNLFDDDGNDITYFYESRLPAEPAPVEDVHFHPVEPRTLRATANWKF
jgi:outer membrane cobalamin receptor